MSFNKAVNIKIHFRIMTMYTSVHRRLCFQGNLLSFLSIVL
jgi:hypothetical protein